MKETFALSKVVDIYQHILSVNNIIYSHTPYAYTINVYNVYI